MKLVTIVALLGLATASYADSKTKTGKAMSDRIDLEVTTMAHVGRRGVGVGNIFDGAYTDASGHAKKGWHITLMPEPDEGQPEQNLVLGVGDHFDLDGATWRIESFQGNTHAILVRAR